MPTTYIHTVNDCDSLALDLTLPGCPVLSEPCAPPPDNRVSCSHSGPNCSSCSIRAQYVDTLGVRWREAGKGRTRQRGDRRLRARIPQTVRAYGLVRDSSGSIESTPDASNDCVHIHDVSLLNENVVIPSGYESNNVTVFANLLHANLLDESTVREHCCEPVEHCKCEPAKHCRCEHCCEPAEHKPGACEPAKCGPLDSTGYESSTVSVFAYLLNADLLGADTVCKHCCDHVKHCNPNLLHTVDANTVANLLNTNTAPANLLNAVPWTTPVTSLTLRLCLRTYWVRTC